MWQQEFMGMRGWQYLCVSRTMTAGRVLVVRGLGATVVVVVVAAGIHGNKGVAVYVCQQTTLAGMVLVVRVLAATCTVEDTGEQQKTVVSW